MSARILGACALAGLFAACTAILDFDEPVGPGPGELPDLLQDRDDPPQAFTHPDECAPCHQQHYEEWQITPHAYAMKDPVFKAMVNMGQRDTEGKLGQFCVQCHSPTGLATGQTTVSLDPDTQEYTQNLDLDPIGMSGVTCTACHSITNVIDTKNARVVYTPNGIMHGPIADPVDNEFHPSAYSPLHDNEAEGFGALCGTCHNVVNPKGATIEQTFDEFLESDLRDQGEDCVTCHMPLYTGKAAVGPDAPPAEELPDRTLHRHTFVGVDVSLLPESEFPGFDEMRALSETLLQESVEFSAGYDAGSGQILTTIKNLAGHAIPSGATAERQMWIEVVVRNDLGNIMFQSGTLDPEGNLRDGLAKHTSMPGTDLQLAYFGQVMIAINGFADMSDEGKAAAREQIELDCLPFAQGAIAAGSLGVPVDMPWEADWQCDDLLAPDATDFNSYLLGPLPPGTYSARVRLLFRSFPPYFLTLLETEGGLDPAVKTRVPTVQMAREDLNFVIP
jgi:hypothetical protein